MPFCAQCGKEITDAMAFCGNCGHALKRDNGHAVSPAAPTIPANENSVPGTISDEEYSAFIQQNAAVYVPKFRQFMVGGIDNFTATWHWPAFFAGFPWLLYRKLYVWALIVFVVNLVPYVAFITSIAMGISANYLYYKHAREKITALKTASSSVSAATLAEVGGVNTWVVVVSIVFGVLVLLAVVVAIVIPNM